MSMDLRCTTRRLARFGLITPDAERLAGFYAQAFGVRRLATEHLSDSQGVPDGETVAKRILLGLGNEIIELLEYVAPGDAYPKDASASDLIFQHFAIVVAAMDRAYRNLQDTPGWRAISTAGPELLPKSSGGVTAFKFRDPDGHPLELLAFPEGAQRQSWHARSGTDLCLGIDHSAISVADTQNSVAFYRSLGFQVAARTFNQGAEQQRLDGMADARVEVTALVPRDATPHIELLCYEEVRRRPIVLHDRDVAATRLVLELENPPAALELLSGSLRDPDGHRLAIAVAGHRSAAATSKSKDPEISMR